MRLVRSAFFIVVIAPSFLWAQTATPAETGATTPTPVVTTLETPSPTASPLPNPETSSSPLKDTPTSTSNTDNLAQTTPLSAETAKPDAPIVTAGVLSAPWTDLDFSNAHLSLAGPNALYVRGVKFKDSTWSLLLRQTGDTVWKVSEAWDEASNLYPSGVFFDLATVRIDGGRTLTIDGIILDGAPVKKVATIQDDGSLIVATTFESGSVVGSSLERSRILGKPVYEEKVTGLERLNADSLGKIGNLEADKKKVADERDAALQDNTKLKETQAELAKQNDEIRSAMEELKGRNSALSSEADNLKAELATLKDAKTGATPSPTPAVTTTSTASVPNNKDTEISTLQGQVGALEGQVKELQNRVSKLETSVSGGNGAAGADVESLKKQIVDLQSKNEALMVERQDIERKLREAFLKSGFIATMKPDFSKTVLSGFSSGRSVQGTWRNKGGILTQSDQKQYFSRFALPLVQKKETLLYRFTVKATGKGWVGEGLHFFAENRASKKGYGHGDSLLIWLTRDPKTYGNNTTYLQLYRSDDDVAMGRVLSAAIPEAISGELNVEVLYQPIEEYVTVAINGVEKIRYKTWFGVADGVEIALRTLNTASFSNLQVLSK